MEQFLAALEAAPNDPRVHFNLGLAYRTLEQFDRAQHHYQRAIALDPASPDYRNSLGIVHFMEGRYAAAVDAFAAALERAPANANYRRNLERARQKLAAPGR